jgi:hypothetical protein
VKRFAWWFFLLLFMSGCASAPLPDPAFDVPALIGKDISGVESTLGAPTEYTPPDSVPHPAGLSEWDKTWERGGKTLLVTYRLNDGGIVDFFISADDPSGATNDEARLLALGNLQRSAPNYRVEFVPAMGHPGKYTGVKIIPN